MGKSMPTNSEKFAIVTLQHALKDPFARIPTRYQSEYYNHQKKLNLKYILQVNLCAQLAYFIYAFIDLYVLSDVGMWIIYSKLVYTLSMTTIALVLYKYYQNVPVFDLLLPYSIAGAAALWFFNLNSSDSPYTLSYQYTSSVFIVLASLGVQFRFLAALFPNFLIVLVTYIGIYCNTQGDWMQFLLFSFSYLALVLFSIYISWHITFKSRILFLHQTLTDIHYQASERLANTDALTGLSNRRAFEHISTHYMQQNTLDEEPMVLTIFDVDYFKKINDNYGHDVGDQVLKHIAEVASNSIRARDVLARFGGEEFTLLLPNTDIKQGFQIAERLRKTLEKGCVHLDNGECLKFTVSVGVAAVHHHYTELRQAFTQADEALYQAKKQGRNCTCLETES
jgi:diguanylate cyclase (GGDEF)-like protein